MTNDRRSSFPTYCQKNEFLKHLSLREKKGLKLNILTRFVGKGGKHWGASLRSKISSENVENVKTSVADASAKVRRCHAISQSDRCL